MAGGPAGRRVGSPQIWTNPLEGGGAVGGQRLIICNNMSVSEPRNNERVEMQNEEVSKRVCGGAERCSKYLITLTEGLSERLSDSLPEGRSSTITEGPSERLSDSLTEGQPRRCQQK